MGKGHVHNGKKISVKNIQIGFNRLKKNLRKTKGKKLYLYQQQTEF